MCVYLALLLLIKDFELIVLKFEETEMMLLQLMIKD